MSKVKLGDSVSLDVSRLIETRMLIQSNSGGGKSWAVRKLLEETHGKVQQIVLDVEGEFGTLREKFDYILAGKGGDLEANPKTAELLAKKVLELEVSIIVDLYELKKPERVLFCKNFVNALVNSPKELWHPCLIVIDEAHVFAPEKGESEAASAVIDLATRGRKRGFAAVLATQRLSKLSKDVAAECLNKLIGRTSLDIDRKRASDELGFTTLTQSLQLRKLKPGQFYSFGPALNDEVELGQIGPVITTHPKAGQRLGFKHTKPTEHIKSVLKKLTDLPQEVEKELKDRESLQAKIKELESQLKKKSASFDPKTTERVLNQAKSHIAKHLLKLNRSLPEALAPILKRTIQECYSVLGEENSNPVYPVQSAPRMYSKAPKPKEITIPNGEDKKELSELGACERKILGFLAMKPDEMFTKVQIGAMTGYRHSSGGFNNALSRLTQAGLIHRVSGQIGLQPGVKDSIQDLIAHAPHTLEDWVTKLGACERAIYQFLLEEPESEFGKEEVAEQTGYSAGSGGFNNALSRLNTLGLIRRESGGRLKINPEVLGL